MQCPDSQFSRQQTVVAPHLSRRSLCVVNRASAALAAVILLASCDTADSSEPPAPSPVAARSTAVRTLSASPAAGLTPTPSPSAAIASPDATTLAVPQVAIGDYLRVVADGLAVRAGPGVHHPLVSEYLLGHEEPIETTLLREQVRLGANHVVRAVVGPIVVDDTAWYAVTNVPQDGQAREDTPIWRSVAPVPYSEIDFELTWIAIAQPGAFFVERTSRPACGSCLDDPGRPTAYASGIGDGRIGPWRNSGPAYITIAAAAPSSSSMCEFRLSNQGGQAMFADEPAIDYMTAFIPGVSPGIDAEVWLDITGDCAWAIRVHV